MGESERFVIRDATGSDTFPGARGDALNKRHKCKGGLFFFAAACGGAKEENSAAERQTGAKKITHLARPDSSHGVRSHDASSASAYTCASGLPRRRNGQQGNSSVSVPPISRDWALRRYRTAQRVAAAAAGHPHYTREPLTCTTDATLRVGPRNSHRTAVRLVSFTRWNQRLRGDDDRISHSRMPPVSLASFLAASVGIKGSHNGDDSTGQRATPPRTNTQTRETARAQ
ncbi:hypothetical protein MRX96_042256 [Rhipicephalus microplus]